MYSRNVSQDVAHEGSPLLSWLPYVFKVTVPIMVVDTNGCQEKLAVYEREDQGC